MYSGHCVDNYYSNPIREGKEFEAPALMDQLIGVDSTKLTPKTTIPRVVFYGR